MMVRKRTFALAAVIISLILMVADVAAGTSRREQMNEADSNISEKLPEDREDAFHY